MHYEGDMIRPPSEAGSILLQVTLGCSHNKCTFCGTFRGKRFNIKKDDIIFKDIEFAAKHMLHQNKLFICDGDALIIPQKRLVKILKQIQKRLPQVNQVSLYANTKSIKMKTEEELKELYELGVTLAYMGLESGDDLTLKKIRKGADSERMIEMVHNVNLLAAINGFALGGGLELAMGCDFRIASSKAKFGQPEVSLGLIPGYAATQRLPRLTGIGDALFLLMTAEMIGADDALRIGLVQKVVEPEDLMETVMGYANMIISKGPKAVTLIKKVVRLGMLQGFDEGSELEADMFGTLFKDEGETGMKAFLEKRKPEW